MTAEKRYTLWLSFATGCEPGRCKALLAAWDTPEQVFDAARRGEVKALLHFSDRAAGELKRKATEGYIDSCLAYLEKKHISAVTVAEPEYPQLLKEIYDPPQTLFYRGILQNIQLPIAVIGSRSCTEYGMEVALNLSQELAEAGVCVISGLALGIDGLAAEGALKSNSDYPTVAVLAGGVDVVYPPSNATLYHRILERGAVVSEMLPGTQPRNMHFPRRNRIISGISRGVAVVESGEKSGTGITVDYALEQGRDVFAVPGRIDAAKSAGTNRLIADGMAKMVLSAQDILEEYGVRAREKPARADVDISALSYEQALLYKLLLVQERSFDELCVLSGFAAPTLNSTLTELEFSGIIKQSPGRRYKL